MVLQTSGDSTSSEEITPICIYCSYVYEPIYRPDDWDDIESTFLCLECWEELYPEEVKNSGRAR